MKRWFRQNKNGIIIGFLFGTLGLWALIGLSLLVPYVGLLMNILIMPSKIVGEQFFGNFGQGPMIPLPPMGAIISLTVFNGMLYALIGGVLQQFFRKSSRNL